MTDPDDQQFVTALFSQLDDVTASNDLRRRVAQIPIEYERSPASWPFARLWQSLAAFGALATLGVLVGALGAPDVTHPEIGGAPIEQGSADFAENEAEVAAKRQPGIENSELLVDSPDDPLENLFALALSEPWESWETTSNGYLDDTEVTR